MVRLNRPGKLTRIKRLPWMDILTRMTWLNRKISMRMVAWLTSVGSREIAKIKTSMFITTTIPWMNRRTEYTD